MLEGQTVYVRDSHHRHYTKWGVAKNEHMRKIGTALADNTLIKSLVYAKEL